MNNVKFYIRDDAPMLLGDRELKLVRRFYKVLYNKELYCYNTKTKEWVLSFYETIDDLPPKSSCSFLREISEEEAFLEAL